MTQVACTSSCKSSGLGTVEVPSHPASCVMTHIEHIFVGTAGTVLSPFGPSCHRLKSKYKHPQAPLMEGRQAVLPDAPWPLQVVSLSSWPIALQPAAPPSSPARCAPQVFVPCLFVISLCGMVCGTRPNQLAVLFCLLLSILVQQSLCWLLHKLSSIAKCS